jgi:hypothetical protein
MRIQKGEVKQQPHARQPCAKNPVFAWYTVGCLACEKWKYTFGKDCVGVQGLPKMAV